MTGRDLIVYILENNLEDEPVFKDGVLLGFMSIGKAAEKFNVGKSTVEIWIRLGQLKGVKVGNTFLIPANVKSPLEGGEVCRN